MNSARQGLLRTWVKEGMMSALSPGQRARKVDRPAALLPLMTICLSELRGDIARLIDSRWDEAPRRRARELAAAVEEACHRQGLEALAIVARSMKNLLGLPRVEALPLGSALREKLEELLRMAERAVSEELRRQTA